MTPCDFRSVFNYSNFCLSNVGSANSNQQKTCEAKELCRKRQAKCFQSAAPHSAFVPFEKREKNYRRHNSKLSVSRFCRFDAGAFENCAAWMKGKAECCLRGRVLHKWPPQTNITRNQPRSRALNELQKTHSWRAQLSAASARLGLERRYLGPATDVERPEE